MKTFMIMAILFGSAVSAYAGFSLQPETASKPVTAPSREKMAAVRLKGFAEFSGKKIVLSYVSGREALIGTPGMTLNVISRKAAPLESEVSSEGIANFPATTIATGGFEVFNFVHFEVRDGEESLASFYLGSDKLGELKTESGVIEITSQALRR